MDYELLKDAQTGVRLVRFGAFAGYAGACLSPPLLTTYTLNRCPTAC
jgi:hypothetical protein